MSSPPVHYTRQANFTDYQSAHPNDPPLGSDMDAELNAVATALNKTEDRLAELQRSDGALKNAVVTPDSLSTAALALIAGVGTPKGNWLTTTAYVGLDLVAINGNAYICVVAHTAGVFATDLAAGKWMLFSNGLAPWVYNSGTDAMTLGVATLGLTTALTLVGAFTMTGALAVTGNTRLTGLLGIGMVPVNALDITQDQNNTSIIKILNPNAGNIAQAHLQASNGTTIADLYVNGTGFATSGLDVANGVSLKASGAGGMALFTSVNQPVRLGVNGVEYMRLMTGRLQINTIAGGASALGVQGTGTDNVATFYNVGANYMVAINSAALGVSTGDSAVNAMMNIRKDSTSSRSINAAGTINASGADYAEYHHKAPGCGVVAAGQIIGFDANGLITDKWADAVSFGVKTTNPSYVGGDVWGSEEALGIEKPAQPQPETVNVDAVIADVPVLPEDIADDHPDVIAIRADISKAQAKDAAAHDAKMQQYTASRAIFDAALETARQGVDRIAYAGVVPVNVMGAAPGDYILAAQEGAGIKGVRVGSPTFDQYRTAVGRVRKLEQDGRANIAVMVH